MKRQVGLTLSLVATLLSSAAIIRAQSDGAQKQGEQPNVVKAVAPSDYPAIAVAARAEGKVIIEVKIDEKGQVKSAKGVEGLPLLQAISSVAARRWRFAPAADGSKDRSARLTFIFRLLSDKEKSQQETSFNPPYEIVYAVVPPKMVQRVNY
jgi:TonB family protein